MPQFNGPNKKRIDPRYFLHEAAEQATEPWNPRWGAEPEAPTPEEQKETAEIDKAKKEVLDAARAKYPVFSELVEYVREDPKNTSMALTDIENAFFGSGASAYYKRTGIDKYLEEIKSDIESDKMPGWFPGGKWEKLLGLAEEEKEKIKKRREGASTEKPSVVASTRV